MIPREFAVKRSGAEHLVMTEADRCAIRTHDSTCRDAAF
jgi:hypothetical protein